MVMVVMVLMVVTGGCAHASKSPVDLGPPVASAPVRVPDLDPAAADRPSAGRPDTIAGSWIGRYQGAGASAEPVRFTADLTVDGHDVRGTVEEPNTFGHPAASHLRATVEGTVDGTEVSFTKAYDGTGGVDHAVTYVGTMDADHRRIEGTWRTSGAAGTFVMTRP